MIGLLNLGSLVLGLIAGYFLSLISGDIKSVTIGIGSFFLNHFLQYRKEPLFFPMGLR